jgi:glycosyltransferase involved in cell wall biosynthesis
LPRQALIFDAIDDWLEHPEMGPYRAAAKSGYEIVCQHADLITCVATDLQVRFKAARAPVRWIPNGIGPEFFKPSRMLPADLASIPRPRVGYVGVIERRVDVSLVAWLCNRLPHVQFCFVGPYDRDHVAPLLCHQNCHFLGKRDFSLMPDYIASFDVCLLPHVVDNSTRRMNPLKLYEYLAVGKPIVATRVAGVDQFTELISVADTPNQFVDLLQAWLQDPETAERVQIRQAAVRSCSWSSRVDEMVRELDEVAGGRLLARADPCA